MYQSTIRNFFRLLACVVVLAPLPPASAGSAKRAIQGDWQLQIDIDGRKMPSVLSLYKDADDGFKGEWISFFGITELREIEYESRELSFVTTLWLGEGDTVTKFAGSVKKGELSGTFSNDRGEYAARGKRIRRIPMAAGTWQSKLKMGDREFTADLVIKADTEGKLRAEWKSRYGEHEVTNVHFKSGRLTFDRKSRFRDRQWESSFEGTLKAHTLSGTIKSDRGEITLEGKRLGAAIIGQWELEVKSDSWTRKQLLMVFPDLSARYGAISIEKVNLEGQDVTFKTSREYDDRTYDIGFTGRIKGRKLTGEITSSLGTAEVTGQRRRPVAAGRRTPRIEKTPREPDVIYVPTPQKVVEKMLEVAQVKKDDLLYDLGCGDGRIVVTAAKRYGCKAVGYELRRGRV
ncbi:MAG: class I SAM-dependent methyltransferase, partial [Phycisphaerales bacterium]